jgi:hypothetical protein
LLPVISQSGCSPTTISTDTSGQVITCSATGAGGSASRAVTIKRDATAPTVSVTSPSSGAYVLGSTVNASYTCADTLSGPATCAGNVANGAAIATSKVGNFAFTVTSTDFADNAVTSVVRYSVVASAPTYNLAPNPLSFGNQAIGSLTSQAITLKNNGSSVLPVTGIALTGGNASQFSESDSCGGSVGPGGSCAITVVFKPTTAGAKASIITVTAGGSAAQKVAVSGVALAAAYTINQSALGFGTQAVGVASAPQSLIVTNTGGVALPITSLALFGQNLTQFSQTNTCSSSLGVGSACIVLVTFLPTAIGDKATSLKISVKGGATNQSVSVSGTGAIPTYSLNPTSIAFGNVARGTSSAPTPITLTNTGSAVLPISGITATGPFTESSTCGSSVPIGGTCTIDVTFSPAGKGAKAGTVKVTPSKGAAIETAGLSGTGT